EGIMFVCLPRERWGELAIPNPAVDRLLRQVGLEALQRLQVRILILGRTGSLERVRVLLAEMVRRSKVPAGRVISLSMSRRDIADYLDMSVETVSRALGQLEAR